MWQREYVRRLAETEDEVRNFLGFITPGAGKTRAALSYVKKYQDQFDRAIIVSPRTEVARQWSAAAWEHFRVNIATDYAKQHRLDKGFYGLSTTYQSVVSNPHYFRKLLGNERYVLIADEPHHMGDKSSWGESMLEAFEYGSRRLLMTGTPIRTDGTAMPWAEYDSDGFVTPHFSYTYRQAVMDGSARALVTDIMDSELKWSIGPARFALSTQDVTVDEESRMLKVLLDFKGEYPRAAISRGIDRLSIMKQADMPNACGLVVAADIHDAKLCVEILESLGVPRRRIALAHNELIDASDQIQRARDGVVDWLVAVQMVSEGVDVPNIGVLVYLTHLRTELFFRQVVGRALRQTGHDVKAQLVIPNVPTLVRLAENMENESLQALKDRDEIRKSVEVGERGVSMFESHGSSNVELNRVVDRSDVILPNAWDAARRVREQAGVTTSVEQVHKLCEFLQSPVLTQDAEPAEPPTLSLQDEITALYAHETALVKSLTKLRVKRTGSSAADIKPDIQRALFKHMGHEPKKRNKAELEERIAWLNEAISRELESLSR